MNLRNLVNSAFGRLGQPVSVIADPSNQPVTAETKVVVMDPPPSPISPPFNFKNALIEEFSGRFGEAREAGQRARSKGEGSIYCATCPKTISANKVQCLACSEMTEFLFLNISRGGYRGSEALARREELRVQFVGSHDVPTRIPELLDFVFNLVDSTHPGQATAVAAIGLVGPMLAEQPATEPEDDHTHDLIRADSDGMAHAA